MICIMRFTFFVLFVSYHTRARFIQCIHVKNMLVCSIGPALTRLASLLMQTQATIVV